MYIMRDTKTGQKDILRGTVMGDIERERKRDLTIALTLMNFLQIVIKAGRGG